MINYKNIALPGELVDRIDEVIFHSGMGYKTRGEFVKEAVRNLLREIKNHNSLSLTDTGPIHKQVTNKGY